MRSDRRPVPGRGSTPKPARATDAAPPDTTAVLTKLGSRRERNTVPPHGRDFGNRFQGASVQNH
jgi:hypothetical protein